MVKRFAETAVRGAMKEREHSQWQFGHPVMFSDKPKASAP